MPKILQMTLYVLLVTFSFGCKDHEHERPTSATKKVESYYTCSMHPQIRESKPGKCPICQMNLTKVEIDHDHGEQNHDESLKVVYQCKDYPDVTSEVQETCPIDGTQMVKKTNGMNAGDVVAKVKLRKSQVTHFTPSTFSVTKMKMTKKLRVLGQVKSAEEKRSTIAARFPARVEKVYIQSVGALIRRGDPVVQVYSPQLLTAAEELLLSYKKMNDSTEYKNLYEKAREKLILWGIRPSQINNWSRQNKIPKSINLYATNSGVVRKRIAVPGKYFNEGQNYFELSDLSQVWVEMDVYEHDSNLIKPGQKVDLKFIAIPGQSVRGEIDFISPTINERTRTLKVRTTISNDRGLLKPGMVAQASVSVELEGLPLVIPNTAIIDTGVRKVVWVQKSDKSFLAKVIETGFSSDGYSQIVSGLSEDDRVVIEGGFLLDAQAQLFGGYEDFNSQPANSHNH